MTDNNYNQTSDISDSDFDILVQKYQDETITEDEAAILKAYLMQQEYVEKFVMIHKQEQAVFDILSSISDSELENDSCDCDILHKFAEYENQAPVVNIPSDNKSTELDLDIIERPVLLAKAERPSPLAIAAAAAAIIFLVVYIKFNPLTPSPRAALLADTYKCEWTGDVQNLNQGDNIYLNEVITLANGIIELKTDRNVSIVMEAPARFQFKTQSELTLSYGKMYSKVQKEGTGFTVKTPNAMIVDLGTEFSINVDRYLRSTEVQMYKGSAVISNSKDDSSREILKAGIAKSVDNFGVMEDIPFIQNSVMDRPLSSYEKQIEISNVSTYYTFNDKASWVNRYLSSFDLKDHIEYTNVLFQQFANNNKAGIADSSAYFSPDIDNPGYVIFDKIPVYEENSFTVALWFKTDIDANPQDNKQFIASRFMPVGQKGWRMGLLDNKPFVRLSGHVDGELIQLWYTSDITIDDNNWHSIAMVVDRNTGTFKGYLDGSDISWHSASKDTLEKSDVEFQITNKMDNSIAKSMDLSNDIKIHLGVRSNSLSYPFYGNIYDMAIWDYALKPEAIKKLYSNFPLDK